MTFWNHNKAVANASFRNEVAVKAIECDAVGPSTIYMQLYHYVFLLYSCFSFPHFPHPKVQTGASNLKAPFLWRHAGLEPIEQFLKSERACGRFRPAFKMDF